MKILVQGPGALGQMMAINLQLLASQKKPLLDCSQLQISLLDYNIGRSLKLQSSGLNWLDIGQKPPAKDYTNTPLNVINPNDLEDLQDCFDALLLCVKSYQLLPAFQQSLSSLKKTAVVISLANGLGHLQSLESMWPATQCGVALSTYGSKLDSIGCQFSISQGGKIVLASKEYEKNSDLRNPNLSLLQEAFESANFQIELNDDPEFALWHKAVINCAINPVATLLQCENGKLLEAHLLEEAGLLALEAAKVAQNRGISLAQERDYWIAAISEVCKATSQNRCSMLRDFELGRKTEIEALSGMVLKLAQKHKLSCPKTSEYYQKLSQK